MKKLLFLSILILNTLAYAKMMDAIAMIVEGEPITTAEIRTVQSKAHISRQQAVDLLIQDRLQKAAMRDIVIPESAIDQEVARIAQQNGLSVSKMQKILKQQGIRWSKYRKTIREALKKRTFFKEKVAPSIPMPSDEELQHFYTNHKSKFIIPATVAVTEYAAPTEAALKTFVSTGKSKGIQAKKLTKSTQKMNPALMNTFLQTPIGRFTNIMNAGDRYIVYKIRAKRGKAQMPFESAKGAVAAQWRQQQQEQALKDYFQKMKTKANIKILRR
jgi:parvulin-like peptidyl-prolyl isomerase